MENRRPWACVESNETLRKIKCDTVIFDFVLNGKFSGKKATKKSTILFVRVCTNRSRPAAIHDICDRERERTEQNNACAFLKKNFRTAQLRQEFRRKIRSVIRLSASETKRKTKNNENVIYVNVKRWSHNPVIYIIVVQRTQYQNKSVQCSFRRRSEVCVRNEFSVAFPVMLQSIASIGTYYNFFNLIATMYGAYVMLESIFWSKNLSFNEPIIQVQNSKQLTTFDSK